MTSHFAPKLIVAIVTFILASTGMTALQERTAHAEEIDVTCQDIARNSQNDLIRTTLEQKVAGKTIRLTHFKSVRIDRIAQLQSDNDCDMTVVLQVTLKRRLLRDVHGTATVHAHVSALLNCPTADELVDHPDQKPIFELYFDDIRVTNVELSHIGEFREWLFEAIANRALPYDEALPLPELAATVCSVVPHP